jgi:hypothetical protein
MTDSIDTSEREAEEPDQSRPQNWDYETATRVFVGGALLPIREMAAEPAPPPVAAGYEPHPVGTGERIRRLERVNAELVEALLDEADEWARYVVEDTAPMTLRKYLERKVAALTSATKEQQK